MAHVLIVDDDAAIREALCDLLTDEGHRVEQATDGELALVRLREHPEGMVVLLDLEMPGVDGLQVLHTLATEGLLAQRHAYILLTASSFLLPRRLDDLLKQLGIPLVAKPFNIDTLLAAVDHAAAQLPRASA